MFLKNHAKSKVFQKHQRQKAFFELFFFFFPNWAKFWYFQKIPLKGFLLEKLNRSLVSSIKSQAGVLLPNENEWNGYFSVVSNEISGMFTLGRKMFHFGKTNILDVKK